MNEKRISRAAAEARRFLEILGKQQIASGADGRVPCPKESGALRRASMDLTRVLAEMRRPG